MLDLARTLKSPKSATIMSSFYFPDVASDMGNVSMNYTHMESGSAEIFAESLFRILTLSAIFLISVPLNIIVLVIVFRRRRHKSRVNILVMHLTLADLFVALINIPTDVVWFWTVRWLAGNAMCKIIMFIESFNMYGSSFILIVISLDRYAAIVHPLSIHQADRRCKIMVRAAWACSALCSVPQFMVHEVLSPYEAPDFTQCVDYRFAFEHQTLWWLYHIFVTLAMYVVPLITIFTCYTAIIYKICRKTKQARQSVNNNESSVLRRSCSSSLPRARMKALRLTATIVTAFVMCWGPYYVLSTWYHFDTRWQTGAGLPNPDWMIHIMMALGYSNICLDPIIYGIFVTRFSLCHRRGKSAVMHPLTTYRRSTLNSKVITNDGHTSSVRFNHTLVSSKNSCSGTHAAIDTVTPLVDGDARRNIFVNRRETSTTT
ncbi:gonadotropin-releasing hormone II receptor-like [Lytechinus variegatus]|uniref:gonadotropin-releasing hormone II receptor-like n=1 Tax=Lytechinus variegatus TaxID=7654 RepID=UPI001BB1CD53|nr:gonadotropin-releasing hormone II receptor-like [Lytechinus variegatus]XP_041463863.1 gonadotropin-releasing hormone II receptor-like [Lytechinus variegatus]